MQKYYIIIAVLALSCTCDAVPASHSSGPSMHTVIYKGDSYQYDTKYFTVPLDHFGYATNHTFQLRYLINDTFWKNGYGPIFVYTGNEGSIEAFAQNTGLMWDLAPKYKALLVFIEHRYYGASLPFGNVSLSKPEYSGYLTSEQALADFAMVLKGIQTEYKQKSKIIAFGGSYGGMLAAWIRMKYPHIVLGSIASSAPILQFDGITPCEAFGQLVTADFRVNGKECAKTIQKSWSIINNITSTDDGKQWLSKAWNLCEPLKTAENVTTMKDWLTNIWTNLAMVDYPYPATFLEPLPANPIKAVCNNMRNSSVDDKRLMKFIFLGLNVYFNYTGTTKCLDINQQTLPSIDATGWDLQSCTEMVMPMCYDGINDFFEKTPWNFTDYSEQCFRRWGVRPRLHAAELMYGGRDIHAASNIVFTNGLLDPWSSGGVTQSISDSVVAIVIPDAAHHLDLRAENKMDPPSVITARKNITAYIDKWLFEETYYVKTNSV